MEEQYEEARRLIQRVELHDYYRFLGEDLIAKTDLKSGKSTSCKWKEYKEAVIEKFAAIAEKENIAFDPSLLLIDICKMDMGTEVHSFSQRLIDRERILFLLFRFLTSLSPTILLTCLPAVHCFLEPFKIGKYSFIRVEVQSRIKV